MGFKKGWKKFWDLLWKDDSLKGWVFSVIFLFVFIKFIFLPIIGLVAGTALPLAIVESCSMYHQGDLFSDMDDWAERHDSKYLPFDAEATDFSKFFLSNGMNKGDILFVTGANPEKLDVGDIIIFTTNQKTPVIHRIIEIKTVNGERVFSTIGDNNNGQLSFEHNILSSQIVGKASIKLAPFIGWIKLIFYEHQKRETDRGFCVER